MLNRKIKENNQIKKEEKLDQIQAFRTSGIFRPCLGAINLLFLILGLVFLATSVVQSNRIKKISISIHGGLA
ncbi:MAG: hypothetical protein ACFFFH_19470 [Candidatus Thorarchaeota archaeon]